MRIFLPSADPDREGRLPIATDPAAHPTAPTHWLTRNVLAIGMLSLFSDASHELVTAVLPLFLATFGVGAAALGLIEGLSDAAGAILRLWMSFHSDRMGRRKPILVVSYAITAFLGLIGLATAWWQVLVIRATAWMGRGARGPVRDALLSESVPDNVHGRAFGFEGALDTVGAILGPAMALALGGLLPLRGILLLALIPGAITVGIAALWVHEVHRVPRPTMRLGRSLRELPESFRAFAAAVGVFGLGDFAHSLLVLHAARILTPTQGATAAGSVAIALYILHNVVYAAASYPVGVLADRGNRIVLLACGYALFALMCVGFIATGPSVPWLAAWFAIAGLSVAIVDATQRSALAAMVPLALRGTGYGALATVNALGDLVSSVVVGVLWTRVSVAAGFGYAAIATAFGALLLIRCVIRTR